MISVHSKAGNKAGKAHRGPENEKENSLDGQENAFQN
jgi:hypothetical protein